MASCPDLPPEILPEILRHLPKVHHLTRTALVDHLFYQATIPELYKRASIYSWHKEGKLKVLLLFRTLASCPHLARYIRRLGMHIPILLIRDFPKHQLTDEGLKDILQGLRNCTNLRSCTWTRDGSLTSGILYALLNAPSSPEASPHLSSSPMPSLRELEINGHHVHLFDPKLLLHFRWLSKISIIMPTLEVIQVLEEWVEILQGTLTSLNLICRTSPLITDDTLIRMAPSLQNLEFFHLTGCPKVTHKGIRAVLSENENGIKSLGLEGVSPRLVHLNPQPTFHNLRSLTLSLPPLNPSPPPPPNGHHHNYTTIQRWIARSELSNYTSTLSSLLTSTNAPNLEQFQIYSPYMFLEPCDATSTLFRALVKDHGDRLKRISVHRMLIDMDVITEICSRCFKLEELFMVIEPGYLDDLALRIHNAKSLRTIHVNYPLEAHTEDGGTAVLRLSEAVNFVRQCRNPSLTQFGCNARVHRRIVERENDSGEKVKEIEIDLGPYESPDVPEQFLVVRA
ncbi:hypothetical protein AGABI1DRAFT_75876 [Agaricus bisporus var. burnettii JB137-S8]|uniref:F-box domain-containing protein n=1 Tax=Agaricus bisporus var. burnettii (strain JB137-S8 / ATCC MYA-4627 / FGSC 10392) TaxID=597362 RepID=K5VV26_AGABU|nr:uncharacterized protein AGABI1DRAFT_75876 [Agaricus bisporus var. burnettii JB137-S8]EKM78334.1 hypothetical protein AGABI1DRAFT_75876 [Agaricus bisporus var. burnettii JB137-S8]